MLSNRFWQALRTDHACFALGGGPVLRYPADVIPFAGLPEITSQSLKGLRDLLAPEEKIFIVADYVPENEFLAQVADLPGFQMHFRGNPIPPGTRKNPGVTIQRLGREHAREMILLTDIAFPGFFRERTYELGSYFGIFSDGHLAAMAGERIATGGMREISAVCTHPEHTGKGYATALIRHLIAFHAEHNLQSFLHVAAENKRALSLYEHLGFLTEVSLHFRQLQRISMQ